MRVVLILMLASVTLAAEADLSTPKDAAKSLFTAVAAADRDAIAAVLFAGDDAQKELASAMAELIANGKRLGDAAHEKFGKEGDPIGRGMIDPAGLTRLDSAVVNQRGETATVEIPGQPRPMTFGRADGKWKLVITDFAGGTAANIAKQTRLIRMMAEALDESARDVSAGKYKTPDAANAAIAQRLHEVMLKLHRPATTRAATAPATQSGEVTK